MFKASIKELQAGQVQRLILSDRQGILSFAAVIQYWQSHADFRLFFIKQLAAVPFAAYFWEMPPLTRQTLQQSFECVLVNSPALESVQADAECFSDYFSADVAVVDFSNLGGDAWLLSPCPRGDLYHYPHLAAFSRQAVMSQQQALWQRLGVLIDERLGDERDEPLWLSTSGLGVAWLHLRLDKAPKYYSYRPYCQVPFR